MRFMQAFGVVRELQCQVVTLGPAEKPHILSRCREGGGFS